MPLIVGVTIDSKVEPLEFNCPGCHQKMDLPSEIVDVTPLDHLRCSYCHTHITAGEKEGKWPFA